MINNYDYLLHEAERTRNQAEQRQADALMGQIAAAVARRADSLTRLWIRSLRPCVAGGAPPSPELPGQQTRAHR